jgi:hypothetical protein
VPARPVVTTRRSALAAAAGMTGLAVAGCTSDSPADPTDPVSTSAPPVDADQSLVDDVIRRLSTALGTVVAAGEASRPLKRELAKLNRMHVAHLEALGADGNWTAFAGTPGRREVLALETRLQKFLTTAAVTAESGTLAKLLATMSAAVAQHVAVLG